MQTVYLKDNDSCYSMMEGNFIVIPRSFEAECKHLQEELDLLCKDYPAIGEALENGSQYTLNISLTELSKTLPKKRLRVDSYTRLVRLLQVQGITLQIHSRRTKV